MSKSHSTSCFAGRETIRPFVFHRPFGVSGCFGGTSMLNPTERSGQAPACEDLYYLVLRRYVYASAANM
jgi:hypothetical protein